MFYSSGGGYSEYTVFGDYTLSDFIQNTDPYNLLVTNSGDQEPLTGVNTDLTITFDFEGTYDYIEVWANGINKGNATMPDKTFTFNAIDLDGDLTVTDIKIRVFFSSAGGYQNFILYGDYFLSDSDSTVVLPAEMSLINTIDDYRINSSDMEFDSNYTTYIFDVGLSVISRTYDFQNISASAQTSMGLSHSSLLKIATSSDNMITSLGSLIGTQPDEIVTVTSSLQYLYVSMYGGTSKVLDVDWTFTDNYFTNYNVEFVDYNGFVLDTQAIGNGLDATAPTDPVRVGHDFIGWDVLFTGVTGDLIVTALYEVSTFTVTFTDHDGSVLLESDILYGSSALAPDNPVRVGYIFSGWDTSISTILEDTIVTAQYNVLQFNVEFVNYNGSVLKIEIVNSGSNATAPTVPVRVGYTFIGWDDVLTNILSDQVLIAQYELNEYTVTFTDHDGSVVDTETVLHGSDVTPPTDPVWLDHDFSGWSGSYTSVTENRTLVAVYDVILYDMTFLDFDGSFIEVISVAIHTDSAVPTEPVRVGFDFTGWSGDITNVTAPVTVLAQYEASVYTVTFLDHDGSEILVSNVGHQQNAPTPDDPERVGYDFSGWTLSIESVTEDLIVTALYNIPSYTVTFMYNGNVLKNETVFEGQDATAPDTTLEGYVFNSWSVPLINITSDITILAEYDRASYTVTFNDYNDVLIDTELVLHGNSVLLPVDPERTGYYFNGWSDSVTTITENLTVTAIYSMVDPSIYPVIIEKYVNKTWLISDSWDFYIKFKDTVDFDLFDFTHLIINDTIVYNHLLADETLIDLESAYFTRDGKDMLKISIPYGNYGFTKDMEAEEFEIQLLGIDDLENSISLFYDYRLDSIGLISNLVGGADSLADPLNVNDIESADPDAVIYTRWIGGRLALGNDKELDSELEYAPHTNLLKYWDWVVGTPILNEITMFDKLFDVSTFPETERNIWQKFIALFDTEPELEETA